MMFQRVNKRKRQRESLLNSCLRPAGFHKMLEEPVLPSANLLFGRGKKTQSGER